MTKIVKFAISLVAITTLCASNFLYSSYAVTFPDIDGVKKGRAPYLIGLWTVNPDTSARDQLFCSGVLIDKYHFLTAAHCLTTNQGVIAVGGSTSLSERGQTLVITDSAIHPRYDAKTAQNDIGIARLYYGVDKSAEWGKFIGSYPEIPENDKGFRRDMRVFGWGDRQNGRSSNVVTSVTQTEYKTESKKSFKDFNEATMLGAGFKYKNEKLYAGACNGDSGGPLIANESTKPVLIGLVSYGSSKGCDARKPTVYTRVAYYKTWIESMKKQFATNWKKKGIEPGSSPSKFSLPVFSSRFLASQRGDYGPYTSVKLSIDPDTGRADMNEMMLQVYNDGTIGINLYLSNQIDGCLFRQKGFIKLQVATNSFQDIDFSAAIDSNNGCYKNDQTVTSYNVKIPPNDYSGTCSVTITPFKGSERSYKRATDVDSFALQFNSRCLGKVSQIWVRAWIWIDDGKNESDIEPGTDMWVGPLNPKE